MSATSARRDCDDCTAEAVVHTRPTGTGHIAAPAPGYGTGRRPMEPADGRASTLDPDGLPRPDAAR
ncbi:hypothetical protein ACYTFC_10705 [Streptomyces globosus]